ncbi:MAG: PIN domain-containing protein [Deltaproteobacteria bacterium]|nr:PIN domain-containing protein [Deltaproteobacteria bacterium]
MPRRRRVGAPLGIRFQVFLPYVVLGELRAGFALGRHGKKNEQILNQFLLSENVGILWPNDQTTFHYAALFRQLRSQGTPIPTNDLWIAALVTQHSLALCDRDRHFDHLPLILRV